MRGKCSLCGKSRKIVGWTSIITGNKMCNTCNNTIDLEFKVNWWEGKRMYPSDLTKALTTTIEIIEEKYPQSKRILSKLHKTGIYQSVYIH